MSVLPEFSSEMVWEWTNASLAFLMQHGEEFLKQVYALDADTLSRIFLVNHAVWVAMSVISKLRAIDRQPEKDSSSSSSSGNAKKSRNILAKLPLFTGFLLMCVSGMGGALTVALLTGDKGIFIGNDEFLAAFFLVWIVMVYAPGLIFYTIANFFPIKFVIVCIEGIFLSRVVCGNVDAAVTSFPGSHLTPILLGTFSGFGGALLGGFLFQQLGSTAKHELTLPTWGSKMALFTSSFYYLSAYVLKTPLPPVEIAGKSYQFTLNNIVAAAYVFVMVANVVIFPGTPTCEPVKQPQPQPQPQPPKLQPQPPKKQDSPSPSPKKGKKL